jgi:phage host-nuclease inhibitor protein Gam
MEENIHQIKTKVQLLIKQFQQLQKENNKLKLELGESKNKLKLQEETITLLKNEMDAIKLNKNQLTKQDKISLEKRIDEYLKEVNTCLTILNKD